MKILRSIRYGFVEKRKVRLVCLGITCLQVPKETERGTRSPRPGAAVWVLRTQPNVDPLCRAASALNSGAASPDLVTFLTTQHMQVHVQNSLRTPFEVSAGLGRVFLFLYFSILCSEVL